MRNLAFSAVIAVVAGLIALPSFADTAPVESVDVDFDIQAIESPAAAAFWTNLEGDLEEAILARVVERIEDEGSKIWIDVDEFNLSNSLQAALGEDSTLKAGITVKNEADPTQNSFYDLSITLLEAGKLVQGNDGTEILTLPEAEAYRVMVNAFADNVVSRLE